MFPSVSKENKLIWSYCAGLQKFLKITNPNPEGLKLPDPADPDPEHWLEESKDLLLLAFQRVRSASLIIFLLCVSLRISVSAGKRILIWIRICHTTHTDSTLMNAEFVGTDSYCGDGLSTKELSFLLWSAELIKRFCVFIYDTYVSDSDQADEAFRAGWREEEEGPDDPVLTGTRSFREEFFYTAPLFPDEILIRRMARVVFLHPDLGIGGAERLVVDAALALQAKGHQVKISWGIWFFRHLPENDCLDTV
jgi:hypothetical protein